MSYEKAVARAWTDEAYKAKLRSNPNAALEEMDVTIPPGTTVKVVDVPSNTMILLLLDPPPQMGDVSPEELEKMAGHSLDSPSMRSCSTTGCCSSSCCCYSVQLCPN